MTKYEIILYWSDGDESFIAEAPDLPGCVADGPTRQEAIANAQVVISEWLETARELGRPVPEPKGRLHSCEASIVVKAQSTVGRFAG
jgi:predicted RNase H-like HicB family nuclease